MIRISGNSTGLTSTASGMISPGSAVSDRPFPGRFLFQSDIVRFQNTSYAASRTIGIALHPSISPKQKMNRSRIDCGISFSPINRHPKEP